METYELVQSYISQLNRSTATVKAYKLDLDEFSSHVNDINDKDQLIEYQKFILSSVSQATSKRKIASVSAFYAWMHEQGFIKNNVFKDVKTHIKPIKGQYVAADDGSIELMLKNAKTMKSSINGYRNLIMCEILVYTGCTIGQLLNLKRDDFDATSNTLYFGISRIKLNNKVANDLKNYLNAEESNIKSHNDYLIYSNLDNYDALSDQRVSNIVKSLSNNKCSPRSIRSRWLRNNFNEAAILLLNHLNVNKFETMDRISDSI